MEIVVIAPARPAPAGGAIRIKASKNRHYRCPTGNIVEILTALALFFPFVASFQIVAIAGARPVRLAIVVMFPF